MGLGFHYYCGIGISLLLWNWALGFHCCGIEISLLLWNWTLGFHCCGIGISLVLRDGDFTGTVELGFRITLMWDCYFTIIVGLGFHCYYGFWISLFLWDWDFTVSVGLESHSS